MARSTIPSCSSTSNFSSMQMALASRSSKRSAGRNSTPLLNSLQDLDTKALGRWQAAMNHENYHPLGGAVTSGFLRNVVVQLSAHGEFADEAPIRGESDRP